MAAVSSQTVAHSTIATGVDERSISLPDELAGVVAEFLGGPSKDTTQSGNKMLSEAVDAIESTLHKVLPGVGVVSEVSLTRFLLDEVAAGDCSRLELSVREGLLSVVYDVFFSKEGVREEILDIVPRKILAKFLYTAANQGLSHVVKKLILTPAYTERLQDKHLRRALLEAAEEGHGECVGEILSSPVVDRISDIGLGRALGGAAWSGDVTCFRTILSDEALCARIPDDYFGTALQNAAGRGHIACIRELLSQEAFARRITDEDIGFALESAAEKNELESVKEFLKQADLVARIPDERLGSAVSRAAFEGSLTCLKEILSHSGLKTRIARADLAEAFPNTAQNGHLECLREMLSHTDLVGRISGEEVGYILSAAALEGQIECLEEVLSSDDLVGRITDRVLNLSLKNAAHSIECVEKILLHGNLVEHMTDEVLADVLYSMAILGHHDSVGTPPSVEDCEHFDPTDEQIVALRNVASTKNHAAFAVFTPTLRFLNNYAVIGEKTAEKLLHEFNLVFSADVYGDVKTLFGESFPLDTDEKVELFMTCVADVISGYARQEEDSTAKQKAQLFLHSIWESHGSPETDEGLDFAPNHMWDSAEILALAVSDCT